MPPRRFRRGRRRLPGPSRPPRRRNCLPLTHHPKMGNEPPGPEQRLRGPATEGSPFLPDDPRSPREDSGFATSPRRAPPGAPMPQNDLRRFALHRLPLRFRIDPLEERIAPALAALADVRNLGLLGLGVGCAAAARYLLGEAGEEGKAR